MSTLARDTVTSASRIMLPVYPVQAMWLGVALIESSPQRVSSSSFDAAKAVLPIRAWGVLFAALAVFLLVGYAMRSRDVTVFVLYVAAIAYASWAFCLIWSAFADEAASLGGPSWPLFVCAACCASASSVARHEGEERGR